MLYAQVAVARPVYCTYTYSIPDIMEDQAQIGKRVLVPLKKLRVTGYIISLSPETLPDDIDIKNILDILDQAPLFNSEMLELFRWIAEYYIYPPGLVIESALPTGLSINDISTIQITDKGKDPDIKLTFLEKDILSMLKSQGESNVSSICKKTGAAKAIIERLSRQGLIEHRYKLKKGTVSTKKKRVYKDPLGETIEPDTPPELTQEQTQIVDEIESNIDKGFSAYLIYGITGSGKTEIYMKIADSVIKKGKTALILVPEIALISQTERRFRARFGDHIGLLHSGLSPRQRYDQWTRIAKGDAPIAIGVRSAVFTPVKNIGVIIVDEEHDESYKQDKGLPYNAKDVAVVRAKQENAIVILGSATPSVQTYYNAYSKKFIELKLTQRVNSRPLPLIEIVDLSEIRDKKGAGHFMSEKLIESIKNTLEKKEQAILFLNRRGFAGFPVCRECGKTLLCKNCNITLTFHKSINAYRCHFCGFTRSGTSTCPDCGSSQIMHLGLGTEKIEEAVKKIFPQAKTARIDADTVSKKGSLVKTLKGIKNQEIDIIIGTQMIAKGHDFPNITLVGIICADLSLNIPDFRAGERTFQLLAQVAGRAGRGDSLGKVILQTYNPTHPTILTAQKQDFKTFYKSEIEFRKSLRYPPFSRLALIKISGKSEVKTKEHAAKLAQICRELKEKNAFKEINILGPAPSAISKIANRYRWQILLKSSKNRSLQSLIKKLISENMSVLRSKEVKAAFDVDPFFML